jgi:hypothetical protein
MPKPVLQAMVLADHVYRDRQTGKHIIAGTFTTLMVGQMKVVPDLAGNRNVITGVVSRAGSPYLYLALTEVHGQVPLVIKFVDLSDGTVLFEAQCTVASHDPVAVAEYILTMPSLPANKPGNYSLDLMYEGEIIGSWRIFVKNIPEKVGEGKAE